MILFFAALKVVALLSYLILMLFTLRSKAEKHLRIYFTVYLCGMSFWQFTSLMVNFSRTAEVALFWYKLVFASTFTWATLFFPFSRAFLKITKQKTLMVLAFLTCFVLLGSSILGLQWQSVSLGRGGYWVPVLNSKWLYVLVAASAFFFFCGFTNLIRGLRREKSPVQRNRIFYVLMGAGIVVIGLTSNVTGLQGYPVDIAFNLASAFVIGYAVVRYRLLDIRFVLVRSLFYSILTGALVAVYLGIVFGLEITLKQLVGYTGSASGLISILFLAVVFLPLRNGLQKTLDRLFSREKYDYQKATLSFSRDITSLYDADAILDLVGGTIAKTVKTVGISIALLDEEKKAYLVKKIFGAEPSSVEDAALPERTALAHWLRKEGKPLVREEALMDPERRLLVEENPALFTTSDVSLVAPILLHDKLLGTLNVGPKLAGTMYNDEDLRFLTTIANQTATAFEKSTVYREMQRRLSEQTLLFILSEKFRGITEFDSVMMSIVQILKNFLTCEYCALVSFEREGSVKMFALDPLSREAAEVASSLRGKALADSRERREAFPLNPEEIERIVDERDNLSEQEKLLISSFVYFPLQNGSEALGMLVLPNRTGRRTIDARELELLRTIRAILSQGIILYRTIVNLVSVKTYNENILNSLNDMGDTLIILDLKSRIKSVNRATCERLGYREEDLVGKPMSLVAGDGEPLFTEGGFQRLIEAGSISNYEMSYRTREGTPVPMLFSGSVLTGEDGETREIVGIARDITEHMKAEEMSKNVLLIKEIHHRIKNNLQVISSLLYLQSGYVQDEKTREMFKESQNRVRSMALLHEKLYQSRSPAGIDFSEYIHDLTRSLFMSYGIQSSAVDLTIDISGITLGMDTAVPCGLIINELVSNAIKHAFPNGRSGEVAIEMRCAERPASRRSEGEEERWYQLTVRDNGKGFPEKLDFRATESLGLKLVCTLTDQLNGAIELSRDGGTRFQILFKEL